MMTREEAIVNLKKLIALFHTESEQSKMVDYSKIIETLEFAASALHPVSREQVEKVWRGYWIHEEIQSNQSTTGHFKISSCECSKCGCYVQQEANFCPYCGAAQTDEAVEITMKRL